MKKLFSALSILLVSAGSVSAQMMEEEEAVMATVNRLFDGMKAADTAMVRSTFSSEATMGRAGVNPNTGEVEITTSPMDGFVTFIASMQPGQLDEPIWDPVVQIDDNLATVWVKYELLLNGAFHHCGVDAFDLWKSADGWKIFRLTDTSRTENCWHKPE